MITPDILPSISCIVPCLNECENLKVLLPCLEAVLETNSSEWEILVVDDGSNDTTPELMALWTTRLGFRYLQLSRNFGKEAALSAGLETAEGDVVVCLDADLQHPPALIPEMLDKWRAGADAVYAVRIHRETESWIKQYGSSLLYFILGRESRISIPANSCDFRLMNCKVVKALTQLPERTRFMKGLHAWVGFKTEAIEYLPPERLHGTSHYSFFQLVKFAIDGITAFSTWPLRVLSLLGAAAASISFSYGTYLILAYLTVGNEVSGWTTIVTFMLFFFGTNLLALGVIGAYIGRIFDEVKQRPLYIVRKSLGRGINSDSAPS